MAQRWQMHLGRAEDVLPGLEPTVGLVVTDPPYGVAYQSGSRAVPWKKIEGDETARRSEVYAVLSATVSLYRYPNQHMYVFGDWDDLAQVRSVFKTVELVWDKMAPGMGDLSLTWSRSYEHIQFALVNRTTRSRGDSLMRKRRGAVLRHSAITGLRASRHPTEKPVPLLRELIEASSRIGDLVLDPYAGSGSTGVAAILEGRRFVGVEVEPHYYDIACERLEGAEQIWERQVAA